MAGSKRHAVLAGAEHGGADVHALEAGRPPDIARSTVRIGPK